MTQFLTSAYYTGVVGESTELLSRAPWVYLIASTSSKILYVGETNADGGIMSRLGEHFGPGVNSTLRRRATESAGVARLSGPWIIIAGRLASGEELACYDGESKQVRCTFEAAIHERVVTHTTQLLPRWRLVSTIASAPIPPTAALRSACVELAETMESNLISLVPLARGTPLQVCILQPSRLTLPSFDFAQSLRQIEVSLHQYVVNSLKNCHGTENQKWWFAGIPDPVRKSCAARREDESNNQLPAESFMDLIDLRNIITKDWVLFGPMMERLSGEKGKDKATAWIIELNNIRKIWAHPVKEIYTNIDDTRKAWVVSLGDKLAKALRLIAPCTGPRQQAE